MFHRSLLSSTLLLITLTACTSSPVTTVPEISPSPEQALETPSPEPTAPITFPPGPTTPTSIQTPTFPEASASSETETNPEAEIRTAMVDMSKDPDILAYYQGLDSELGKEASKRWAEGIRPLNGDIFERVKAESGFKIVYKGTDVAIDGMAVALGVPTSTTAGATTSDTTQTQNNTAEAQTRIFMVDMNKDSDILAYYRTLETPTVQEAIRRWDAGQRPLNADIFERVKAEAGGFKIVYKGSDIDINGLAVQLGQPTGESTAASTEDPFEARVRTILADLAQGAELAYYQNISDPAAIDALGRWEDGIRPLNNEIFERKIVSGQGYSIVYKGTDRIINGNDVQLSLSGSFDESRVKYILVELGFDVDVSYFEGLETREADEAVRRFKNGIRVSNLDSFERITLSGQGPVVVYKGTQIKIAGDAVKTRSAGSFDDDRVRYILAEMGQGVPQDYYNGIDEPEAKEAQRLWATGIRVNNNASFERRSVTGEGTIMVYKGTNTEISGESVVLSNE